MISPPTIAALVDLENDEKTIKMLFAYKRVTTESDYLFITIEKYSKIRYTYRTKDGEEPYWTFLVLRYIEERIHAHYGYYLESIIEQDDSLQKIWTLWEYAGSKKKKNEIGKLLGLIQHHKQQKLVKELTMNLDGFNEELKDVLE